MAIETADIVLMRSDPLGISGALVMDVIDRVPGLGACYAGLRQKMSDARLDARSYARTHGDDIPEVKDWVWPDAGDAATERQTAQMTTTGGDNE